MSWWAEYVGLPFQDGGRGPGSYDCWGLVRAVYAKALAVDLPSYGEISARDLARVARAMASGHEADPWKPVEKAQEFDVVLMRSGRGGQAVVHVGIAASARHLLHVEATTAAVVVPMNHVSVAGRIVGFRRYVA